MCFQQGMTAIATPFQMIGNEQANSRMTGVMNSILQQQRGVSAPAQRMTQANVAQNSPANYTINQQAGAQQFEDKMSQQALGLTGKLGESKSDQAANALSNVAAGKEQGWRDSATKQFASNLLTGSQLSVQSQLANLINAPESARLNAAGQMDPWIQFLLMGLQQSGLGLNAANKAGAFSSSGSSGAGSGPGPANPGPVNLP